MKNGQSIINEIKTRFEDLEFMQQSTTDSLTTLWISNDRVLDVLRYLKGEATRPFSMLLDLSVIDERQRAHREGQPDSDFTVVYHLLSYERNEDLRIKAAMQGEYPSMKSITALWPSADWYEREAWDMFGVTFEGHPRLRRILMPAEWQGHPLRKEHPARATEMGSYFLSEEKQEQEERALRFRPEDWGMRPGCGDTEFMFLNLGPQHPGTHGLLRMILQLDGEEIVDAVPEIGFHHRGAEKMGERQTWHTYIPYTDRIDYLGGVMNNLAYVMGVEQLAGIEVPDRAKVVRVMSMILFSTSPAGWMNTTAWC